MIIISKAEQRWPKTKFNDIFPALLYSELICLFKSKLQALFTLLVSTASLDLYNNFLNIEIIRFCSFSLLKQTFGEKKKCAITSLDFIQH